MTPRLARRTRSGPSSSTRTLLPQLWFDTVRTWSSSWHIDDDWVFYAMDTIFTAEQVEALVESYRSQGIARRNTLP